MLIVYGSKQCPDVAACREDLDMAGVPYEYRDIGEELLYLKEFLKYRDTEPAMQGIKAEGKIGIPCMIDPAGEVTLDWQRFLENDRSGR
jgi:glutaredoxin-related protein